MSFVWAQEDSVSALTQGWYGGKEGCRMRKPGPAAGGG